MSAGQHSMVVLASTAWLCCGCATSRPLTGQSCDEPTDQKENLYRTSDRSSNRDTGFVDQGITNHGGQKPPGQQYTTTGSSRALLDRGSIPDRCRPRSPGRRRPARRHPASGRFPMSPSSSRCPPQRPETARLTSRAPCGPRTLANLPPASVAVLGRSAACALMVVGPCRENTTRPRSGGQVTVSGDSAGT